MKSVAEPGLIPAANQSITISRVLVGMIEGSS